MSRVVSPAAQIAILANETAEAVLILLEITEASLDEPIRVVQNNENITSRGNVYAGYPFEIDLPAESTEISRSVKLEIDAVDQQIIQAVRQAGERADVRMEVVLSSTPDIVEAGPFDFKLRSVQFDHQTVTGDLVFSEIETRKSPAHSFTSHLFPDLF